VRKYYELLIAKDYNEAARLTGAFTAESRAKRREAWDNANLNILEIISIGEPRAPKQSWGVMIVPCTITGEINGQRIEKSLENVYVRRVLGHPNRRIVEFDESSKMH
jgi:hypothetical protein